MPVSSGMLRKVSASTAALAPHCMQTERIIVSHQNVIADDHRSCLASETVNARLTVALNRVGIAHHGHDYDLRGHYLLKTNSTRVCMRPYCTALRQLTRSNVVQNDPRPAVVQFLTTKDRRLREPYPIVYAQRDFAKFFRQEMKTLQKNLQAATSLSL